MTLNGIVEQAERRGESLFQADPNLSSDLRKMDVVSDLEHSRAHIRSAMAKIEEYPCGDDTVRAEIIEYLSKNLKRLGQTIMKYRKVN